MKYILTQETAPATDPGVDYKTIVYCMDDESVTYFARDMSGYTLYYITVDNTEFDLTISQYKDSWLSHIVSHTYNLDDGYGTIIFDIPIDESITWVFCERAYAGSPSITQISFPPNAISIGEGFCCYQSQLEYVSIPSNVTSIGSNAFYDCTNLTEVEIDSNAITSSSTPIKDIFGAQVTSYFFKEEIINIANNTCGGATNLTNIAFSENSLVTTIGDSAFTRTGIISLTIPDSVIYIGENAFGYCKNLNGVTLGNSVTSIGEYAFGGDSKLTSIILPVSLSSIGSGAFEGCTSLSSIIYRGTMLQWNFITKGAGWASSVTGCTVECTDGNIAI